MMTTHYSSACSCLLTHSTLGYTEPLNKVKCTDGGVKKKITKVQEYHRCSTIVQRRQVPEFVPKLELRSHKKCLSLCGKTEERRSKESWLTLGPVIKKLFTDLEKETAYSPWEAQCPPQIPLLIHLSLVHFVTC